MKKHLNIHLEGMDDNGEKLKEILDQDMPVAISIAPETFRKEGIYKNQYPYLLRYTDLIGEIVSRNGSVLGQQGNLHKCKYPHRFADPWHENFCLYGKDLTGDEQRELMGKGKETLLKLFGKSPELYVPPNHMFDLTTIKVAGDMDYDFFAERGIVLNEPYKMGGMIILPETKFSELGDIKYVHYDEIEKNRNYFEAIMKKSGFSSLDSIETREVSPELCTDNLIKIRRRKFLRDFIKFPKRILKK